MNKKQFLQELAVGAAQLSLELRDVERALANFIVAHVFFRTADENRIGGYLKGGSAQIWRFGLLDNRQTRDIDVVIDADRAEARKMLESMQNFRLGDFSIGRISIQPNRTSTKIPADYRIVVAKVQLKIADSAWLTCDLEILPLEEYSTSFRSNASEDIASLISILCIPELEALPIISAELQIAEKLHALTEPGSDRATDLLDIARAKRSITLDMNVLTTEVIRVYARRMTHPLTYTWMPSAQVRESFMQMADQKQFDVAVTEVNELLGSICKPA